MEFLAATVEGKSYVHGRISNPDAEYGFSSEIVERFLLTAYPFRRHFNAKLAKEFYNSIRCGLLHEAATKNGWRIFAASASGSDLIDAKRKIVYRNDLQDALLAFVSDYGERLKVDVALQAAFIRKFDSLST